jgi:membrane protease YdiL (CAAX protease family)
MRRFFIQRDDHVGEYRPLDQWDELWRPRWWLDPPDDPRQGDWFWLIAIFVLVAYANIIANAVLADVWHIPFNLGVLGVAVAIARGHQTSWTDMGMRTDRIKRGLTVGGLVMIGIGLGIAVAVAIPATREAFRDDRILERSTAYLLFDALVRIPIATALYEEALFRGVIFAMLSRRMAPLWAALISAGLFGFWHILPTLETVESNPVGGIFAGVLGLTIASVGAVVGTAIAGMAFMWLRWRANSIAAPILAHIATNSFAILAGIVVVKIPG